MSPRAAVMVAVAHEYLSRRTPVTRLPRAGGVGYRREAARVAGGGPRGLPGQRASATSSPWRRRAPARPPTPCGSPPSCSTAASSARSPWSPPPSTSRPSGPTPPARVGIQLNPAFSNSSALQSHEYDGVALTYAQVASKPQLHRRRTEETPTLVILDEIHHGGDARSWGDGIREAFERRDPAAVAHRHAVPLRHQPDPLRALRDGRGRHPALGVGLQLRVRRGAARRGRAPGALPRLRRRDALAHQGR